MVSAEQQLQERVTELAAELADRTREAAAKERQLERYAADLRETFKEERARAQELRRSYMLTVRALASAVEARDAYTGRHAERVAAYGLRLADVLRHATRRPPRDGVRLPAARRRQGRGARRDPLQARSADERRAADHAAAPDHRLGDRSRHRLPRRGARRHPPPPRALGRRRLSGPAGQRRDPGLGADLRARRHDRRADDRPPVPAGIDVRRRARADRAGRRHAFRSGRRRRVR